MIRVTRPMSPLSASDVFLDSLHPDQQKMIDVACDTINNTLKSTLFCEYTNPDFAVLQYLHVMYSAEGWDCGEITDNSFTIGPQKFCS